nr:hypothetical protein [Tanacetum cinerariifolium]
MSLGIGFPGDKSPGKRRTNLGDYNINGFPQRHSEGFLGDMSLGIGFPGDLSPGKRRWGSLESLTRLPQRRFPGGKSPGKPIPSDMSPRKPSECRWGKPLML